ncbi:770_t:CDS:1 [Diversispora eburnea]|uniref:770_t:CDS:1 n=1 Tax=Diversispora eburnea TaxID=1213867 RepID=A0A9N8UYR8_9GLOM|nr:770_t:CDS:1 [Diversispora eburnea]
MAVDVREIFNDYKKEKQVPPKRNAMEEMKEIFKDVKKRVRRDSIMSISQYQMDKNEKTIIIMSRGKSIPKLPVECMRRIIKHVEKKRDILSCLLVNKYWCINVIPLLWERPFDNVSTENRYKLIRTYISCLEEEEKSCLNYSLKKFKLKIPYSASALFKYASCLERLSYTSLYMAVDSGIKKYLNEEVLGYSKHQQTILIVGALCQLFMRQSRNIASFEIIKFFGKMDLPRSLVFSNAECTLSNLLRFEFEYEREMTINTLQLLKYIAKYSNNLLTLVLKFPYFVDNKMEIEINAIANIINSQTQLTEFNVLGLRYGVKTILLALSSQANSLKSIKFMKCDFKDVDFQLLANCKELNNLTIQYCEGLTEKNISNLNEFTLKSFVIGFSPIESSSQILLISLIADKFLKELTLDLVTPETIETILEHCPNLVKLKLANYFIRRTTKIGELLRGLKYLRELEIFISSKNADYENMILTSNDLPPSLECLILKCGFTTVQLDNLLSRCDLKTLIVDYRNFDYSHFRVIIEYAKRNDNLEVLGIGGGGSKDSFAKREWRIIKKLRKDYLVRIIPLREISSW